jgi:hypothetical protein
MKIREAAGVLERMGVAGFNKPKKTPSHPTKSHVVVAKEGAKNIAKGKMSAAFWADRSKWS